MKSRILFHFIRFFVAENYLKIYFRNLQMNIHENGVIRECLNLCREWKEKEIFLMHGRVGERNAYEKLKEMKEISFHKMQNERNEEKLRSDLKSLLYATF